MEGGFYFPPEVWAGAQQLASRDDQTALFDAVIRFSFAGEEPEFPKGSVLAVSWYFVRSSLERMSAISKERRIAGKKGGEAKCAEANAKQAESKLEANESKAEANDKQNQANAKQTETKREANVKPNTNTNTNTNSFLFALDDESPTAPPNEKAKARDNPSGDKSPKIDFDFDKREWVNITDDWLSIWHKAYPAVDIQADLQRMAAWLVANPTQRKKNYALFINRWLTKTQDNGGTHNGRTQFRPVEGNGGLDHIGRPQVIPGADYGKGVDLVAFLGGDGDEGGDET